MSYMDLDDNYVAPNQESLYKDDEPFDFNLDLTANGPRNDDSDKVNPMREQLNECTSNIRALMEKRHDIAKNRERLLYQMKGQNTNDEWLQLKAFNEYKSNDEDDTTKFREFWGQIVQETKTEMANKLLNYMDREINIKNANMQKCRDEMFKAYPKATKGWAEAKAEFDATITSMQKDYNNELSNTSNHSRKCVKSMM